MQTAERASRFLGIEVRPEPALSGAPFDVEALTAGLGSVLLVGHDPSFSLVLHDLTGTQTRMKKGGLACVSKGELILLMRPVDLAAIAAAADVAVQAG
jgi:phosphohistidine phosphatase SixA